jgi:hypothetical protein
MQSVATHPFICCLILYGRQGGASSRIAPRELIAQMGHNRILVRTGNPQRWRPMSGGFATKVTSVAAVNWHKRFEHFAPYAAGCGTSDN